MVAKKAKSQSSDTSSSTVAVPVNNEYRPPEGVKTERSFKIGSQSLKARVDADWIVVREQGVPKAEVFFTSYIAETRGRSERPITFLFNGGPGAASAYLHLGSAGPLRVQFSKTGGSLPPPYTLTPNAESWLPFTDLVFVDPVGTGLSRTVSESRTERAPFDGDKAKQDERAREIPESQRSFYKVKRDIDVLCEFINTYLSRERRWNSSVHIAGESYGGFRVAKLIRELPNHGIPLATATLVSPVIDFSHLIGNDYDVKTWISLLPTMAMTARYHGKLRGAAARKSIVEVGESAFAYALNEFAPLLLKGSRASTAERNRVFRDIAAMVGLSEEAVALSNGRMPFYRFTRQLLADEGKVCGFYDASVTGPEAFPDREGTPSPDPTLVGIEGTFNSGMNHLLRSELGLKTDRFYTLLNEDVWRGWADDRRQHYADLHLEASDDIRYGLAGAQHLKVFITHGYYDLVTPWASSQMCVDLMRLAPAQQKRVSLENYDGGHMYYTWERSRVNFTKRMRTLIQG